MSTPTPKTGDLRIYHNPQIPGPAFRVAVPDVRAAGELLHTLAQYDLWQLEHNIKPDYSSMQGLEVYDPEASLRDEGEGPWARDDDGWFEWYSTEDLTLNDHMRAGSDLDTLIWIGPWTT